MSDDQQQPRRGLLAYFKDVFSRDREADERDRLRDAIDADASDMSEDTALSDDEREMLLNILKYGELRVDDVMVPRVDIVGADMALNLDELVKHISSTSHSRMPVYRGLLDDIQGLVHVKDLLKTLSDGVDAGSFKLDTIMRPVLFVPPSMRVMDLLEKMRRQRMHLAIVIDEYGGTDGLVTIEDLVEQIVGDIEDEHDIDDEPDIRPAPGGCYDADARLEIEELETILGVDFLEDEADDDVDTLGGLVFSLAGEVPEIGDKVDHASGVTFEVVDADPRRIKKVRIHKGPASQSDPVSEAEA